MSATDAGVQSQCSVHSSNVSNALLHKSQSSTAAPLQVGNKKPTTTCTNTLLLRHSFLQRSCYGTIARCFIAGPIVVSSCERNITCRRVSQTSCQVAGGVHQNMSAPARPQLESVRTLTKQKFTQQRMMSFNSGESLSKAKTIHLNSNRWVEFLAASLFGMLGTASLAFAWYESGASVKNASASTESNPRIAVTSRRTPNVTVATNSATAAPSASRTKTSKRPYDVSVRAIRGGRFTMEDEYFVGNGGRFAAVFDGHGGSGVSAFLKATLYDTVNEFLRQKHWEVDDFRIQQYHGKEQQMQQKVNDKQEKGASLSSKNDVVKTMQDDQKYFQENDCMPSVASHVAALRAGFEKIERDVIANDALAFQGSTAVAVILHESEDGSRTILSANVGDSRAVLSRNGKAVDLTRDHKPNDEREKRRILAMGETIEWDAECMVHRVRNLSLARAIGDRYAKPAVSPEVEIKHFPVSEGDDEFVILASDGLWDVMTSQDVVDFIKKYIENEVSRMNKDNAANYRLVLRRNIAKLLAREAIRKGSTDNICVLIVWL